MREDNSAQYYSRRQRKSRIFSFVDRRQGLHSDAECDLICLLEIAQLRCPTPGDVDTFRMCRRRNRKERNTRIQFALNGQEDTGHRQTLSAYAVGV